MITACLAWYMEPVEFLDRCVRSLMPLCDRLVALDGRWGLFPGERDLSTAEERIAIADAARESGLDVEIYSAGAPLEFESQVAKRDRLMEIAGANADPRGGDWLLVIDGDEHLAADREHADAARELLDRSVLDVAELLIRPMNEGWPLREMPANTVKARRIYRAGTRCPGPAHNVYRFDGRYLEGDTMYIDRDPALDLSSLLMIHHDNQNRGRARDAAAKEYRKARGRARAEAWM